MSIMDTTIQNSVDFYKFQRLIFSPYIGYSKMYFQNYFANRSIKLESFTEFLFLYAFYHIIFVQEKLPADLTTEVNLGCDSHMTTHSYKLYVTTFLGYGATTARVRYLGQILTKKNNSVHR